MKNRLLIAPFILLVGLMSHRNVLAEAAIRPLAVEAKLKSAPNGPGLAFTVTNVSGKAVTFDERRLPWGQRYSVVVVAAERKSGSVLKEAPLIDDVFLSPKVSIQPGQSLSGDISLGYYVADIEKKLRSSDLVIFWFYEARSDEGSSGQYGGWIVIPKSSR